MAARDRDEGGLAVYGCFAWYEAKLEMNLMGMMKMELEEGSCMACHHRKGFMHFDSCQIFLFSISLFFHILFHLSYAFCLVLDFYRYDVVER